MSLHVRITHPGPTGTTDPDLLDMARRALASRKRIEGLFPKNIFRDSAWDMMLELFVAAHSGDRLCVKDIILLSGDSSTSAMRRIDQLQAADFLRRTLDHQDHRRVWLDLTNKGHQSMATMLRHLFDTAETSGVAAPRSFTPASSKSQGPT